MLFKKKIQKYIYTDTKSNLKYDKTQGEVEMSFLLEKGLDKEKYYIYNNMIIKNKLTGSSEIDHIVFSVYGIFVIENKDLSGWIFGHKKTWDWKRILFKNSYFFRNPLMQNFSHIKALQEITDIKDKNIFNIVGFSYRGDLIKKVENVFHYGDVVDYIKSFDEIKITESRLEQILGKIEISKKINIISDKDHARNIENYLKNKK